MSPQGIIQIRIVVQEDTGTDSRHIISLWKTWKTEMQIKTKFIILFTVALYNIINKSDVANV